MTQVCPNWENIFPEFWSLVFSLFEEEWTWSDRDLRLVCKKWNEIYKKNNFLLFKSYVFKSRKFRWEIDFLVALDVIVATGRSFAGVYEVGHRKEFVNFKKTEQDIRIDFMRRRGKKTFKLKEANLQSFPQTRRLHEKIFMDQWLVNNLDKFLWRNYEKLISVDATPSMLSAVERSGIKEPTKQTWPNEELPREDLPTYLKKLKSKQKMLDLKKLLSRYNELLNLWSN